MAFVVRDWNEPRNRLKAAEAQRVGPGKGRMAGGWIADLAALNKAVMLCGLCVRKWEPKKYGYRARRLFPGEQYAIGNCDGCGRWDQCTLHLREGTYE